MRCLVVALALTLSGSLCAAGWSNAAEPSEEEAIVSALNGLVGAFNAQDAAAVAAHWSPDGVHVNQETGDRTEGRKAIEAMYAQVFAVGESPRLLVRVDRVQFVTPEVALVDGQATVVNDLGPEASSFSAVVVKHAKEWLLHSSRETALPVTLRPGDRLVALDWLVGDWEDEASDGNVRSSMRWSAKHSFLIRTFRAAVNDEVTYEGTQIFGWDPTNERIRVWMFGSEGGFGEGFVDAAGDRVAIHMKGTLADGRVASATQVLTRTGEHSFSSQLVAHDVDGEPQPTQDPVSVVRVAADETSDATAAPKKPAAKKTPGEKAQPGAAKPEKTKPAAPAKPKPEQPAKPASEKSAKPQKPAIPQE